MFEPNAQTQTAVATTIALSIVAAQEKLGKQLPFPRVESCGGKTAGWMTWHTAGNRDYVLKVNWQLAQENLADYLHNTIPHELAHMVADFLYGNVQSHGSHWRYVMVTVFERQPTRCHDYKVDHITRKHAKLRGKI